VEKYGTAVQTTHDNVKRRMRFACWVTKATDTHSEYVTANLLLFHIKNGFAKRVSMCVSTNICFIVKLSVDSLVEECG